MDIVRKHTRVLILMALLIVACFCVWNAETVHAASGTCGTCSWETNNGVLTIRPTDGVSGTLRSEERINNYSGSHSWPWYSIRSTITSVVVEPGVHTAAGANYLFYALDKCVSMDLTGLDTTGTRLMYDMFKACRSLTTVDVSHFDTSNVTNMSEMFESCESLSSLNVVGFDTSSVTDMSDMFSGCKNLVRLDLRTFDTHAVTTMRYMFSQCSKLYEVVLGVNFDFHGNEITNVSSQAILPTPGNSGATGKWVRIDDEYGPYTPAELRDNYTSEMAGIWVWDLSAYAVLTDDGDLIFFRSHELYSDGSRQTVVDVNGVSYAGIVYSGIELTNVTSVSNCKWYNERLSVLSARVADGQTIKPLNCSYWFRDCENMVSCDLHGLDTSDVTKMACIFYGCRKLADLDISSLDTANVSDMRGMFGNCASLTNLDLSRLNTSKVTNMGGMFYYCSGLRELDVSHFDTHAVIRFEDTIQYGSSHYLSGLFSGCSSLESLDLSNWDTSSATQMGYMFSGCSHLATLDISGFDTSSVTAMDQMFRGCNSLREINLGKHFSFKGNNIRYTSAQALLPTPPDSLDDVVYTKKWIREDGSVPAKTPAQLRSDYGNNAEEWAGVWIWEEKLVHYTLIFLPPDNDNYGGSMFDQKLQADVGGTINPCAFYRFNYHFDHWDASDGRTYADQDTIPANRYAVGDTLTLTAVFEKDDNHLNFDNGEAEIDLHGGEKVTLPDLPGGATYQIWEETPSGWQLIEQTNASGIVPANGSADATFVNEYVPGTATITLMAQKTLDGRTPAENQFSFELVDSEGIVKQTVSNNGAGMVQFSQLVFKQPGTFTYTIREVRGNDSSISYDSHVETVTITVTDDGHGNLTASTPATIDIPAFENETKPGVLTVSKQTDGSGTGDETFTFVIKLTNDYGQPLDNINIVGDTEE